MENEQYEENDKFLDYDGLDQARENLMILERGGHVSFKEVEAVMNYINLKLTQRVSRHDLAKRLRSEAHLQLCTESVMKEKKKQEV